MEQEEIPNREISEAELITSLREHGIHDFGTMTLLDKWTVQEEVRVGKDPLDSITFNQRRANIYLRAGYIDEALDNLGAAATQAKNEDRKELYERILAEIQKIETN